jgi:hypothetical protein
MREARGGEGRNDLGFPGEHPAAGGFVSVKCTTAVGLPICATDGCERPGVDGPVSAQVGAEHGPLWWPTHWLLGCEPKRTWGDRPWAAFCRGPKEQCSTISFVNCCTQF